MKDEYKALGSISTLGLEIVLSIVIGLLAGRYLDSKLHTDPWLMILGFVFGVCAAGKAVLRSLREMRAVARSEEQAQGNPAPRFERSDPSSEKADRNNHEH